MPLQSKCFVVAFFMFGGEKLKMKIKRENLNMIHIKNNPRINIQEKITDSL